MFMKTNIIDPNIGNPEDNNHDKLCEVCLKPLTGMQRKYCSRKCHNSNGNVNHQSYLAQQERALTRKMIAIRMKGGKCQKCGYSNNITALEFHHRDPSQKERKLDSRNLSNGKWEYILLELEKCDLLCSNCHAETHHTDTKFILGDII